MLVSLMVTNISFDVFLYDDNSIPNNYKMYDNVAIGNMY